MTRRAGGRERTGVKWKTHANGRWMPPPRPTDKCKEWRTKEGVTDDQKAQTWPPKLGDKEQSGRMKRLQWPTGPPKLLGDKQEQTVWGRGYENAKVRLKQSEVAIWLPFWPKSLVCHVLSSKFEIEKSSETSEEASSEV